MYLLRRQKQMSLRVTVTFPADENIKLPPVYLMLCVRAMCAHEHPRKTGMEIQAYMYRRNLDWCHTYMPDGTKALIFALRRDPAAEYAAGRAS